MNYQVPQSKEKYLSQCADAGVSMPWSDDTSVLAQPVSIGSKTAANRITYQAMEGCDGTPAGEPGELTRRRYLRFAKGGAGIIWYEATAVIKEGRANPRQLYIDESTLDAHARLVDEIKRTCLAENGFEPLVICQLTHSGRYSKPNGTPEPLIAYNNPLFEGENPIPQDRIVTDGYLDLVGQALCGGAKLAKRAGFDGADIKSCHRYLLSELLSAYNRPGKYGGCFENRTRLLRNTVGEAVSYAGKDFIITSRLNAYDGFEYPLGFGVNPGQGIMPDFSEAVRLVSELHALGAPLIDITMGNPYFNPHVNRPFARGGYEPPEHPLTGVKRMLDGTALIKRSNPDVKIICSGISYLGAVSANVVAGYIADGGFDFAGYGRETLAYPMVARDAAGGVINPAKLCLACGKCTEIMRCPGGTPGCVVRDGDVYAKIYMQLKKQ